MRSALFKQLSLHNLCLPRFALAVLSLQLLPLAMAVVWVHYFFQVLQLQLQPLQTTLAFSGIAVVYGLDRLYDPDPRLDALMQQGLRGLLLLWTVLGLLIAAVCLVAARAVGWPIMLCCLSLAVANWYGKRLWLGKTISVSLAWLCSCACLPFAAYALDGAVLALYGAWLLLFAASCVLCDIKDQEQDAARAIASLPVLVGERWSLRVCSVMCAAGITLAVMQQQLVLIVLGALLLVCMQWPALLRRPLLAPLAVDGSLFIAGLCAVFV